MARTASMGSLVPAAVTSTRSPTRLGRPRRSSTAALIAGGSAMRPSPSWPHASGPLSGPTKRTPRSRRMATLARVAACLHMFTFMAGATRTGARVASSTVVTRSSAIPAAILARVLAVAGATTTASPQSAKAM